MRWHYTKREHLRSILQQGILPSSAGGYVYFLQDEDDEADARVGVADDYPMLTEVDLGEEYDPETNTFRLVKGVVPPRAIVAVQVFDGLQWCNVCYKHKCP